MAKPKQNKDSEPKKTGCSPSTIQIILALISAAATIIVALLASPLLVKWVQSWIEPSPTPTLPTATPVPFARIQSLEVVQDGNVIATLDPNDKITLAAGSNVIVKVNVITKTDINSLLFRWEFCHPENNTKGQGAVEIPYKLRQGGEDCITVKIERGGQFLDAAHFFISTDSSQP